MMNERFLLTLRIAAGHMAVPRWHLFLLLPALLMGCGGTDDDAGSSSTQAKHSSSPTLKTVTHEEAMRAVEEGEGTVTIVNFWATWCVPCVEEFPSFMRLDRELDDRGVDVMFISTDFPDQKTKVVDFLAKQGVTGTSYLKASGNTTEFVNNFSPEWTGAVPATFVYGSEGTLLAFWEGKVSYEELKQRTTKHLDGA